MAKNNFTKEERIQRLKLAKERKQKIEENRIKEVKEKAKIFLGPIGKIMKVVSLLLALLCITQIADGLIPPSFETYETYDAEAETIDLITGDGFQIPATFQHVYLNEEHTSELLMHNIHYKVLQANGTLEIGRSLIFKTPISFITKNDEHAFQLDIERPIYLTYIIPIMVLLLSLLAAFINPASNMQTVNFSYANLVIIPLAIVILGIQFTANMGDVNASIDIYSLDLSSTKTMFYKNN